MLKKILRHQTARQFIKFGTVGTAGFLLENTMVYIGIFLGLGRIPAKIFAFPFAVTFTWFCNRTFTFRLLRKSLKPSALLKEWAHFVSLNLIGWAMNFSTYSLLVLTIPMVYQHPILGNIAGTGVAMFFNFFAAKRFVFK